MFKYPFSLIIVKATIEIPIQQQKIKNAIYSFLNSGSNEAK